MYGKNGPVFWQRGLCIQWHSRFSGAVRCPDFRLNEGRQVRPSGGVARVHTEQTAKVVLVDGVRSNTKAKSHSGVEVKLHDERGAEKLKRGALQRLGLKDRTLCARISETIPCH